MSDNRYRSSGTGSRRDSERSPNHSNDYRHDGRSSAFRRDSDRASDYAKDHFRPARSTPRGGGSYPESRRSASDLYPPPAANANTNPNMDSERADQATSNIAKQLILLYEAQADWVQTKTKRDVVCEGLRQRLATYDRHGGKNALEPSVAEAWQKQHDHLKQEEDKYNKELAKIDGRFKTYAHEYARLLVKELPISDIKERHLLDAAKAELAGEGKSAPAPALAPVSPTTSDDARIEKLEKQMASLVESQQTQQANHVKLTKENEEQRSKIALYEKQAADIAALKTQLEQVLQLQQQHDKLSNEVPHVNETEALKQENTALKSQVSELADLVSRVASRQANASKTLQEATAQFKESMATSSGLMEQVKALELQVKAMESQVKALESQVKPLESQVQPLELQVKEHDKVLSNFDAEEYAAAVSKLINYPDYAELEKMLNGQGSELTRISSESHTLSQQSVALSSDVSNSVNRLATVESRVEALEKFSNHIIKTCGNHVQRLEDKVDRLSKQSSYEAPAEELQKLREFVENELRNLRNGVGESLKAHEMMIMGLDDQFKNMSTMELANIIFDHLKRLLPTLVPLDVQNFHERLVDLEAFRQDHIQRSKHFKALGEDLQKLIQPKRNVAEDDDDGLEQPEKRRRAEVQSG